MVPEAVSRRNELRTIRSQCDSRRLNPLCVSGLVGYWFVWRLCVSCSGVFSFEWDGV